MARNPSIDEFRRQTVHRMPKEIYDAVRDELAKKADQLVNRMKAACPVNADPPPRPGLLRDSIGWTFGAPPKRGLSANLRTQPGNVIATVYAGSNEAFYARWVEFGTHAHSVGKGADVSRGKKQTGPGQHPGSVAQPFFFTTYRAMRNEIKASMKTKVSKIVERHSSG